MLLANLHVIGALPSGDPSLASLSRKLESLREQLDTLGNVYASVDERESDECNKCVAMTGKALAKFEADAADADVVRMRSLTLAACAAIALPPPVMT